MKPIEGMAMDFGRLVEMCVTFVVNMAAMMLLYRGASTKNVPLSVFAAGVFVYVFLRSPQVRLIAWVRRRTVFSRFAEHDVRLHHFLGIFGLMMLALFLLFALARFEPGSAPTHPSLSGQPATTPTPARSTCYVSVGWSTCGCFDCTLKCTKRNPKRSDPWSKQRKRTPAQLAVSQARQPPNDAHRHMHRMMPRQPRPREMRHPGVRLLRPPGPVALAPPRPKNERPLRRSFHLVALNSIIAYVYIFFRQGAKAEKPQKHAARVWVGPGGVTLRAAGRVDERGAWVGRGGALATVEVRAARVGRLERWTCVGYRTRAPLHIDDRPHLRMFPQELWDAVKTRLTQVAANYAAER